MITPMIDLDSNRGAGHSRGGARREERSVAMGDTLGQSEKKPHAVIIPYPAQGHVTPMMKLAKLLRFYGFRITFVNTHFNHTRLLRSGAVVPSEADDPGFRFESIPDGLPPSDTDATQDIPSLCDSISKHALLPFLDLLHRLNDDGGNAPPVSCIVSDGVMSFTLDAARELRIPEVVFWTTSACGFMGYLHFQGLIDRGLTPLKHESDITNGFLDTPIDWVPGMKNMRLRDFPSFIRTTDRDDIMLNYDNREAQRAAMAAAIPNALASLRSNLWKEESGCLDWLAGRAPGSVVYVNFGSITVMSHEQLVEFAWGLADSEYEFLWVVRSDLVPGHAAVLPAEFVEKTRERGMLATLQENKALETKNSISESHFSVSKEYLRRNIPSQSSVSCQNVSQLNRELWMRMDEWKSLGFESSQGGASAPNRERKKVEMVGASSPDWVRKKIEWWPPVRKDVVVAPGMSIGEDEMAPPFSIGRGRGDEEGLSAVGASPDRERVSASWCPQEEVLGHSAVGGFLTHSGWNSTLESIVGGVPMLSWPFFAEQQTNCRYACTEWGNGMEIDNNVKREEVEGLIRELMGNGDKGREMRRRAVGWKEAAERATQPGGSSFLNLDRLVDLLRNF
ncbi:hypothetical protein ZIOFF_066292 [Zingiber officinale]|uniref:Glycosyltransferase n=1 Tax=Zingiber officinale TaxID=94328 RepID=A0A8J5F1K5_ZINOF|nr:hypothetical protein ZIOFF_066292 [Zingiber officinale]